MSDDMLSQDEINALLKGLNDNDGDSEASPSTEVEQSVNLTDYISEFEQDALGEIGNISFGSASTALSTLLNHKVEITTPELSLVIKNELEKEFPQPHVAVHVQYTEGFEGDNVLVVKTSDAAIIADLMLGGDGLNPSEEMDEMHISAVQEAMNQMMGSASTSMATIFNKKVDISPPSINLLDAKKNEGTESLPAEKYLVQVSFRLIVGDLIDSKIMQLVSISFAKLLVDELMNPSNPPVPEEALVEPVQQAQANTMESKQVNEVQQEVAYAPPPPPQQQRPEERQHLGSSFGQQNQRQVDIQPAAFSTFDIPDFTPEKSNNLNMLLDIPLQVTVELGRTTRSIKEILEYTQGSIIELDKLAGEPIDILVNQKLIAKGEVVVIDENFGVRIIDIVSQEDRILNLK